MAITVTSDLTTITACDSTTDGGTFTRLNGTSSSNPAQDLDAYVQGSACVANKMGATFGATDVGVHFNSTLTFDLTNKHIFHWRQIVTAGNMETKANKGVALGLTNTSTTSTSVWSTTNFKKWNLDGKDTVPTAQGWIPYVLDPTSAADDSAGTLTLSSVKNIGFLCRQASTVTSTVSNQFVDAVRMGTGLTATAGGAGDTINFTSLYDTDKLSSNAWGIITKIAGIFYGAGKMTIGSAVQINTCLFKDTNAVLVWRDFPVANTLYEFNLVGAALFATTFQLGDKDGSGNTSGGCAVRGEGAAAWNITCGSNTAFKAYASALANCRAATLSSTSEMKNTSVSSSGTFDVNGATLTNCQFSAHTATQLKVDATSEMSVITGCTFTSTGTGHAVEITVAGTYAFNGLKFNGYAASNGSTGNEAVYVNVASGSVTINVTGGGSTPSIRTAGATVTVNSSVSVTLTGLKNPSEVRVFGAGTTTEVSGSGAENVTSGSHTFSLSAGQSVDISILSLGYQNMRILSYSTTADASVPISQVIDRQFYNP